MTTDDASAALSEIRYTLLFIGTFAAPSGGTPTRGSQPHFMLANWGTQSSFEPWRYTVAVKKVAHTLENAKRAKAFTVNLLDAPQKDLVLRLSKAKGDGHAGAPGPLAAPRLPEAYAGFDCRLVDAPDTGGDHVLVVGEVVDGWKRAGGPALRLEDLKLSYAG